MKQLLVDFCWASLAFSIIWVAIALLTAAPKEHANAEG